MLRSAEVDEAKMQAAADDSELLATDMADYLVGKGVPFREAHAAVSALTDLAADRKVPIAELSLEEFRSQSSAFNDDIYNVTAQASTAARDVVGGTAPVRVAEALRQAKRRLEARESSA